MSGIFGYQQAQAEPAQGYQLPVNLKVETVETRSVFLKDETDSLDFKAVFELYRDQKERFTPVASSNFGINPYAFWFVLPLENSDSKPHSVLLENDYPLVDEVDLFLVQDNGELISAQSAGDMRLLSTHSHPSRQPTFELVLEAGQRTFVLMRMKTLGTLVYQIKIWEVAYFVERLHGTFYALGAYAGLLLLMLIYHGFMYIQLKEFVNLSYMTFLIGNGVFQIAMNGMGFFFLWPEYKGLSNLVPQCAGALGLFAATDFTVRYLNLSGKSGWLNSWILFLKGLSFIIVITAFIFPYDKSLKIFSISAALCFVSYLGIGLYACKQKSRTALYFTLAWSVFGLGMIIMVIRNFGLLPNNAVTMSSVQIGSALEMILLSVGVVDRIQAERQAKMKAEEQANRAERSANLEVKTRFHIASELAHRLNNPLNYVETGVINVQQSLKRLESETYALLEGVEGAEAETVLKTYQLEFRELKEILNTLHQGVALASDCVKEIKVLSGVEGVELAYHTVSDLLTDLLQRWEDNVGKATYSKLPIRLEISSTRAVCLNATIFKNGLEHMLRDALPYFEHIDRIELHTESFDQEHLQIDFFGKTRSDIAEFQNEQSTYGHMLQSTFVRCLLIVEAEHFGIRVLLPYNAQESFEAENVA